MRKQRLECLLRGSWFHSPLLSPAYAPKKSTSSRFDRPAQMYRFYRLSRDFKSLQYLDSSDKRVVEDESDEIFERCQFFIYLLVLAPSFFLGRNLTRGSRGRQMIFLRSTASYRRLELSKRLPAATRRRNGHLSRSRLLSASRFYPLHHLLRSS